MQSFGNRHRTDQKSQVTLIVILCVVAVFFVIAVLRSCGKAEDNGSEAAGEENAESVSYTKITESDEPWEASESRDGGDVTTPGDEGEGEDTGEVGETAEEPPENEESSAWQEAVERAASLGLPAPPDIDVTSWEFVLANASHPLPQDYAPEEIAYVGDTECPQDARIADALYAFSEDCKAAGLPVYLSSGYRSYSTQKMLFDAKVEQYGEEVAATIVLPPGTSEHQTGLCCDITDVYRSPKNPDELSQTETFKWLNAHCEEYGFILRYPADKQDITDIIYEPWHFRYVGVEAAKYIKENNLCLEEFLALYGVE